MKMLSKLINNKWKLAISILPLVLIIVGLKAFVFKNNYEFLSLNALFTALISANIFLIGFLISGTLSDYKESEKLPSEIASSLESIADEGFIVYENKKTKEAKEYVSKIVELNEDILGWFKGDKKIKEIHEKLFSLNRYFLKFESLTQANFISRLKSEQANLRKLTARIDTIKNTTFSSTGYVIAEIITFVSIFGLIFIDIQKNLWESIFFTAFVSYILIYMILFIKDLDNPFEYKKDIAIFDEVSDWALVKSHKSLLEHLEKMD